MGSLIATLAKRGPIITDGAWGTALQQQGLEVGVCPDGWNLSAPEKVEAVARAYVEAGSQIVLTNTFGASRCTLARFGLEGEVGTINRAGVEISRRAAGRSAHVFASIGPTGKLLATGEVSLAELEDAFSEQAIALAQAGADAIVVETMSDLTEAAAAVGAARAAGLEVVVCMVFDSGKEKDRTMMGTTPEQLASLVNLGATAIGANCGHGIEGFLPIGRRLRAATDVPIWIKANAGLPELVEGRAIYRQAPETFAEHAADVVAAGADFIGGCCGTDARFIHALAARL